GQSPSKCQPLPTRAFRFPASEKNEWHYRRCRRPKASAHPKLHRYRIQISSSKILDQYDIVCCRPTAHHQLFAVTRPTERADVVRLEIRELLSRATIDRLREDIPGNQSALDVSYRATVRGPPHDVGIGARRQIDEFGQRATVKRQDRDLRFESRL